MPHPGGPTGRRDRFEGPPSEQARAALSDRLRRELADARVRFEEAGLRAETHRLLGQDAAAADVVAEQEQILADMQDRLGRAVSAAVVERDAEQVLADLVATEPSLVPGRAAPVPEPAPREAAAPVRVPALSGVTSIVAVLGLAAAALLGITGGFGRVEITEAAADSTPMVDLGTEDTTGAPSPDAVFSPRPGGASSDPATVALPASPTGAPDATEAPLAGPSTEDDSPSPTESPTPAPELDTVVQELIDAVAGLDPAGPDPDPSSDPSEDPGDVPEDVGASVPGLEELSDALDGDTTGGGTDDGTGGDDDGGFVPRAPAQ